MEKWHHCLIMKCNIFNGVMMRYITVKIGWALCQPRDIAINSPSWK